MNLYHHAAIKCFLDVLACYWWMRNNYSLSVGRYLGVQDERSDKYKMPLFLPVLSSGYPVLVVNGRGPGPWGSTEGTFIISLTANVM